MKIRIMLSTLTLLLIGCESTVGPEEEDSLTINMNMTWMNPIWGKQAFYEIYVTVEPWRAVREPQFYFELRDTISGRVIDRKSSTAYWDSTFWVLLGETGGEIVKEFPAHGVYKIATAVQFNHPLTIDGYHRPSPKELGIEVRAKVIK